MTSAPAPEAGSSLRDVLRAATLRLRAALVDSPELSARLLIGRALGLDQVALLLRREQTLSGEQLATVEALIARREGGEPAAYVLGEKEFYGRDFIVNQAVLIPRPETEHLVEALLARFAPDERLRFADCGTGSGILAVTLAAHFPSSRGLALDRSAAALEVARANARRHGTAAQLLFLRADFGFLPCPDASLDVIVANPPYVAQAAYATLSHEIRLFEPQQALVPDSPDGNPATGLEAYRALVPQAARALRPRGLLLAEIGFDQADDVRGLIIPTSAHACGPWDSVEILPDLAGHDRVAVFQRTADL